MNTTLDPKPTDREREMLAEWVGRLATIEVASAFHYAENMLREFRDRYGVTGAEVEPVSHLETEVLRLLLGPDRTLEMYDDRSGRVILDGGLADWEFNDLPELIAILKGGNHETI